MNTNGVSGKVITVSWPTRKRYTGDSYTPDALKTNTSPQGHEEMERRFLAEWLVPRADLARSVAARKTVQSVPPGFPGPSPHALRPNTGDNLIVESGHVFVTARGVAEQMHFYRVVGVFVRSF